MNQVWLKCAEVDGVRLWRQNTGLAYSSREIEKLVAGQRGRPIVFGLKGQADLGGIAKPGGVRLEIEAKAGSGRQSEDQKKYQKMIEEHGGIYIIARDPEQAKRDLQAALAARRAA